MPMLPRVDRGKEGCRVQREERGSNWSRWSEKTRGEGGRHEYATLSVVAEAWRRLCHLGVQRWVPCPCLSRGRHRAPRSSSPCLPLTGVHVGRKTS